MFKGFPGEFGQIFAVAGRQEDSTHAVAMAGEDLFFDSANRQQILDLLEKHPVVIHGGSVELCELPES